VTTRSVVVNLVANVSGYLSGMARAQGATGGLSTKALALTGAIGGIAAGFGAAIGKSAEFEQAMSGVQAATQASGAELEKLRQVAMEAGADTQYSATEAAAAITEMSKAGVSSADIIGGGLSGALSLAAAGQMDVAEAAGYASVAMTQFNLTGEDLPHVADLLAAGAGKAMGEVSDLGQALNQVGLVASSTGLGLEETVGTLSAFASAGLIGSDAGTSFKSMLQQLQNPSEKAAGVMSDLGINLYDANGNFAGMTSLAGQLQGAMSTMTPAARDAAMAIMFGSDGVRAANVLYKEGAEGIGEWTAKVNDAGFAEEQAAALTDNLKGDLERLGGAWDTLMIGLGEGSQGPLRMVVQGLTGVIDTIGPVLSGIGSLVGWFTDLPGPVLAAATAAGVLALANGPLAGAIAMSAMALAGWYGRVMAAAGGAGILSGAMVGLRAAAAGTMALLGGPLGLALIGLTAAVAGVSSVMASADEDTQRWAGALREGGKAAAGARKEIEDQSFMDKFLYNLTNWGNTQDVATAKTEEATQANREYWDSLNPVEKAQQKVTEWTNNLAYALEEHGASSEEARTAQERLAYWTEVHASKEGQLQTAIEGATGATGAAAQGIAFIGDAATMTEEQVDAAVKALEDWRGELASISTSFVEPLSVYKAQLEEKYGAEAASMTSTEAMTEAGKTSWRDYAEDVGISLDDAAKALEEQNLAHENWRTNLVTATQRGGLEVGQILAGMGEEGALLTAQMANATDAEFNRMRDAMIEDARLGGAGAAAELDTHMRVMAAIGAAGGKATAYGIAQELGLGLAEVSEIARQYGIELAGTINPVLSAMGRRSIEIEQKPGYVYRGVVPEFAQGGYTGPGGKFQPAGIVHAGEYVLTQDEVDRLGVGAIEEFANRGYADGGFVTAADLPRPRSTAPFRPPISSAADATMQRGYDETAAWLAANAAAGAGDAGSNWQQLFATVQRAIPQARLNSGLRNTPDAHGRGKAVDFGFGTGLGGAGSAGLASIARFLYRGFGRSLYELIYDGVGDDTPDVKNGRDHTYNKITQLQHRNHVHAAVYDGGGILASGAAALNLSGSNERILSPRETTAFEAWMSREFSGGHGAGAGSVSTTDARSYPVTVTAGPDTAAIVAAIRDSQRDLEFLHG